MMQASADPFVSGLWKDAEYVGLGTVHAATSQQWSLVSGRVRKGMFRTVVQSYKGQLLKLMESLSQTNLHFVRCLVPNREKKPRQIDPHLVLHQLRCNCVLEGIQICKQGFPNRLLFPEFKQRFEILTPDAAVGKRETSAEIMKHLGLSDQQYRIGHSKVFLRAGVLTSLEAKRDAKVTTIFVRFQALSRGFLAKAKHEKRVKQISAARIIQRNFAVYLQLRKWAWWRFYSEVVCPILPVFISVRKQMDVDLRQLKETLAEASEVRDRLLAEKQELENLLLETEQRVADEESRCQALTRDLQETVRTLKLEVAAKALAEEKAVLEKAAVEAKCTRLEQALNASEEAAVRVKMECKILEDKLSELRAQLCCEKESRGLALNNLKARYDQTIHELKAQVTQEQGRRAEAEESLCRMQEEQGILRAQHAELKVASADLHNVLQIRETELQELNKLKASYEQTICELEARVAQEEKKLALLTDELQKERQGEVEQREFQKSDKEEMCQDRSRRRQTESSIPESSPKALTTRSEYEVIRPLGSGGFGQVNLVVRRTDRALFVVKAVDLTKIEETVPDKIRGERLIAMALREGESMASMQHPHVVRVFGCFEENVGHRRYYHLTMEYCDSGDLRRVVREQKGPFEEKQIQKWAQQLISVIAYMHSRKIVHRDIKCQNIFVLHGGRFLKLGDFGIAKDIADVSDTDVGSMQYTAPERLNEKYAERPYNEKCDVWALGVVFYEVSCRKLPFDSSDFKLFDLMRAIIGKQPDPIPSGYSANLGNLIAKMLTKEPDHRPDIYEIMEHPFFPQTLDSEY